ncbi:MAG: hypothetical protein WAU07_04865 [Microgenomates group bacterium]
MNKYLIIVLILVAIVTRGYKLGAVPHGMTWDEAAIGYNGYAVLTTRHDEWLERLPVSFQSFGDYKAPAAIYVNGFFTYVFGMNLLAVRLPFFIASLFAVAFIIVIQHILNSEKNSATHYFPYVLSFLFVLSPWHIHFSRVGFESGIALMLLLGAVSFFLLWAQEKKYINNSTLFLVISIILAVASLYTYHSAKIVTPLLFIYLVLKFYKKFTLKLSALSAAIFTVTTFPLIQDSLMGNGLQRASSTVFASHSLIEASKLFLFQWFSYFHPDFIFRGTVDSLRHGDSVWGVLLPTSAVFFYIGLSLVFVKISRRILGKSNQENTLEFTPFLGLVWTAVGLIPAAIGDQPFHSNRALLALPGMLLLVSYGLTYILKISENISITKHILGSHGEIYVMRNSVLGTFIMIHILFSIQYISDYHLQYKVTSSDVYADGYLEAFEIAQKYEKGIEGYPEVDRIIFSSEYGQPYIYALFVRETNPIWYRGGSLSKYEFTENITLGDLSRQSALIVSTPKNNLPIEKASHVVYDSAMKPRFILFLARDI